MLCWSLWDCCARSCSDTRLGVLVIACSRASLMYARPYARSMSLVMPNCCFRSSQYCCASSSSTACIGSTAGAMPKTSCHLSVISCLYFTAFLLLADGPAHRPDGVCSGTGQTWPKHPLGFPIVMAQFWRLRNYTLLHNELKCPRKPSDTVGRPPSKF
jgi:hypothetical protein